MTIPDDIRDALRQGLWKTADAIDWTALTGGQKAKYYEQWTQSSDIGGVLRRYMDAGQVRVYLKDSLLKGYTHGRLGDYARPLRVLGLAHDTKFAETFTKPHGWRLIDGRLIAWGRANDWKAILMALHERSFQESKATPFAAIFFHALGRFYETETRTMIGDAATKLGIQKIVWLEN